MGCTPLRGVVDLLARWRRHDMRLGKWGMRVGRCCGWRC